MPRLIVLGVLLSLAATNAPALEFNKVGEITVEATGCLYEWLSPRYVHMFNEFERPTPTANPTGMAFLIADVLEKKILRLSFPMVDFQKKHATLFPRPEVPSILYFNGQLALLKFQSSAGYLYVVWNSKTQEITEPKQLPGPYFTFIGTDPSEKYVYFYVETLDQKPQPYQGPLSVRIFRLPFPDLNSDWHVDIDLPKRTNQLSFTRSAMTFDGKKIALAEYYDKAWKNKFEAIPPPRVYVVDIESKSVDHYPIGLSPYGLTFSRDGKYLAVGSHEEGHIVRVNLAEKKIDKKVKSMSHVQRFFVSAGDRLLAFQDHIGGPRPVEVRRWSDLKLEQTIPIKKLFPGIDGIHPSQASMSQDGRFLVTPIYGKSGYPEKKIGLVVFEVQENSGRASR